MEGSILAVVKCKATVKGWDRRAVGDGDGECDGEWSLRVRVVRFVGGGKPKVNEGVDGGYEDRGRVVSCLMARDDQGNTSAAR